MVTSRPVRLNSAAACTIALRVRSFWLARPAMLSTATGLPFAALMRASYRHAEPLARRVAPLARACGAGAGGRPASVAGGLDHSVREVPDGPEHHAGLFDL